MVDVKERDYYTVAEAARELDVSPSRVWRWIKARRLPAYRVGERKIRINKRDLGCVVRSARRADEGVPIAAPAMTVDEWRSRTPPTPEELERRHEVVARILANQKGRSTAPLTTADLIRQVREEREERYRSLLKPSS